MKGECEDSNAENRGIKGERRGYELFPITLTTSGKDDMVVVLVEVHMAEVGMVEVGMAEVNIVGVAPGIVVRAIDQLRFVGPIFQMIQKSISNFLCFPYAIEAEKPWRDHTMKDSVFSIRLPM